MVKSTNRWLGILFFATTLLTLGISAAVAKKVYAPIPLPASYQVSDTLSEKDIPTGQSGFARDYSVKLYAGDRVTIELTSDSFDTIVTLLTSDGSMVGENDDSPEGTTNSFLFSQITKTDTYIIRVRAFGVTGVGPFKLKVTRLRPI